MNLYLKIIKNLLDKNSDMDLSKKQHWMPSPKDTTPNVIGLKVEKATSGNYLQYSSKAASKFAAIRGAGLPSM